MSLHFQKYRLFSLVGLLIFVLCIPYSQAQISPSQYNYPHNHLPWYTIESEHFLIHFQKGNSRTAKVSSRIAEEIYPEITNLYGLEPDSKISIILNDREDYSNGAAYFFDNQIEIWIPALDSPLRGTHDWLRNVISHEFTHIVQLQASMKRKRTIPAIYLQWLSYEDVRRPDVLYGYPNGILTYPFASISVPVWLAEGAAQFQRSGWLYDTWDSHRDMVLRTSILNDTYLNLDEMGTFASKTSLEREKAYNQGFAFTSYLVHQFGEEVLVNTSDALSRNGVNSANEAMKIATGTSGNILFAKWIAEQKEFYAKAVENIDSQQTASVEDSGFFNFHPTLSPDGSHIAYLSNKGWDESGTALYLRDLTDSTSTSTKIDVSSIGHTHLFSCGYTDKPLIDRIHSAYDFSPDGNRIVFTKSTLNEYGERYNDLHFFDIEEEESTQLTQNSRLHDPAWSPDGEQIVAIKQSQGTTNLVLINPDNGSEELLTNFENGEQTYTPVWHPDGTTVFVAFSNGKNRDLMRIEVFTKETTMLLEDPYTDYRDPHIDSNGRFLYFTSDRDGIFNIYRMPLSGGEPTKLTNVLGGAFMPETGGNNRLFFSEYQKGGYKISSLSLDNIFPPAGEDRYKIPPLAETDYRGSFYTPPPYITSYDDSDIKSFKNNVYEQSDTSNVPLTIATSGGSDDREFYTYEETFTSMSFYPVVRFDNYSKQYGNNGELLKNGNFSGLGKNLYRDFKIGTYFTSREVIDRLTIFGGALFGPGSVPADGVGDFFSPARLTDLDRDLFLITEYEGLPFIEKKWSPTISLEFYNLRRNVKDGLSIEEFACTACLPDTLNADIAYNIWEVNLFLRSKINDRHLIELGAGYTPYRVQTDGFFSNELQEFIPSTSTQYFRGSRFSAAHIYEQFISYRHDDIAPIGLRTSLRYSYEPGRLLEDYEVEDGTLSPVYKVSKNHSLDFSSQFGFRTYRNSTAQIFGHFFSYLNKPEDPFYLDYIGGFTGMRSYPFFAIGGTTTAFSQLSYTVPLVTDINKQMGRHTLDKLFLRIFAEAGNSWNNSLSSTKLIKTGIGTELRFAFNSYYLFPLKLFISSSYGFNQFDVQLPDEFITENASNNVTYGNELIYHFGLTFDFDVLNR